MAYTWPANGSNVDVWDTELLNWLTDTAFNANATLKDQTQYSLVDGTRAFTNPVAGITPIAAADLTTKDYVDTLVNGLNWQDAVLDKDLTAPPGGPNTGDRYIVASVATGDWATHEDDIAEYNGVTWDFLTPEEGWSLWVEDEDVNYTWNGSSWVKFGSTVSHNNTSGLQGGTSNEYYHLTSAQHTRIADIAALAVTDSNFMVGNGATWVAESGTTVRTSLGLGTGDSPTFAGEAITGAGNVLSSVTSTTTAGAAQAQLIADTAAFYIAAFGSTRGGTTWAGLTGDDQVVIEGQSASSFVISTTGVGPIVFAPGRVERARVNTAGYFGVATNDPVGTVDILGAAGSPAGNLKFTRIAGDLSTTMLSFMPYDVDNSTINFDAYLNDAATAWVSTDAGSNAQIKKTGDQFSINYDSGVAVDSPIAWATGFSLDLITGFLGVNTSGAEKQLHVVTADASGIVSLMEGGANTMALHQNGISRYDTDADNASLWINFTGYNNGTTRFRDLNIGDGKNNRIAFFDGSTGRMGLNTSIPTGLLDMRDGAFALTDSDVVHGLTAITGTNTYGAIEVLSSADGGISLTGVTDSDSTAIRLRGVIGVTNPTDSIGAIVFRGGKSNGTTGGTNLADAETIFAIEKYDGTDVFNVLGNGNLGLGGIVNPTFVIDATTNGDFARFTATPATAWFILDNTFGAGIGNAGIRIQKDGVTKGQIKSNSTQDLEFSTDGVVTKMMIAADGGIHLYNVKTGATKAGAGAATDELWITSSHATLPDGVVMMGI